MAQRKETPKMIYPKFALFNKDSFSGTRKTTACQRVVLRKPANLGHFTPPCQGFCLISTDRYIKLNLDVGDTNIQF
jgi:hypothetical protein